MRALAVPTLACAGLQFQAAPPAPNAPNAASERAVRQLTESLSPKSMWRKMLEHGARGDGIRWPWMDEMRKQGIKLAVLTFDFDWIEGGRGLRNLKDWRLVSAKYFTSYDGLGTSTAQPITDARQISAIGASGLGSRLEAVALARAKRGFWIEDPGHQHPPRQTGTGYKQVFLADNEWLPVQMFPWFGQYEQGTTPLMHAAMLGDVVWIKRLLSKGAQVDAVGAGGWTALCWAAASGGPAAIRALLDAGATVNLNPHGTGDALLEAVLNDHPENVEILLGAGADPNSQNAEGQTVLRVAIYHGYAEIVQLLRQAGARE